MAISIKTGRIGPASVLKYRSIDVTLDSSYPAGGYALGASDFGFIKLHAVIPMSVASGFVMEYSPGTGKLIVYRLGTHTHTENTAGTYTQNAATAASVAAALSEVTAAVNLSTVIVRVFAIGE